MMGKRKWFGPAALALLLALGPMPAWGAGSATVCGTDGCAVPKSSPTEACRPAYDDYALLMAGISNPEGSLAAYEDNPAWIRHARFMDQNWERFTRGRLAPMREWAAREVGARPTDTVFYPFSGPDWINGFTLFPHARTYLLIGLEPVGNLPDVSALKGQSFFASLEGSLYDLLQLDFFLTNRMKASLGKSEIRGTLPVLLCFLAREQARVLEVQDWAMEPDGSITEAAATDASEAGTGIAGVRIIFKRPGEARAQTLYYFQFNLRNDSLGRNQAFMAFLKGFGPMTTFTKAASYLMHKPYFSAIRQFILDQSTEVLQGDSGIPLRHFDPAVWNLKFYGTYAGPIGLFSNCFQADMAERYKRGQDIQPLPFGIGYRHRARTSNLMFATKKAKLLAGDPN
jgi:hypothetical protein